LKVLTDTHTLFWALSNPEELGRKARAALETTAFTASVANLWELILKCQKPGALVPNPVPWWDRFVVGSNVPALAISTRHLRALAALPDFHKDPFDRIMIAQALADGLTIVTKDSIFTKYGIPVIWD
jgi:PIN domain nuclease of toxin-antitoxin system